MEEQYPQPTQDYVVIIECYTYNHELFIENALKGFIMQKTDFSFCALIVDDCSTDGTADIIRKYEKNYPNIIKGFYLNENYHSQKKMKRPIIQPWINRCTYLAECEGDDYWIDPLKLQKQVVFLNENTNYSLCFHRAKIISDIESPIYLKCDDIGDREYKPMELLNNWKIPTASMVARKECLQVKTSGKYLNGDIVFVMKCASIGKIWGMSDEMSVYRMHAKGVTYDKTMKLYRIMNYPYHFMFLKKNFPFLEKKTLNYKIAQAYKNRSNVRESFLPRCLDRFRSLVYRFFARMS